MFEYFFIIGSLLLILSGSLDDFRVHKGISCGVLTALFLLCLVKDTGIAYTYYFSPAGLFIVAVSGFMFAVMPNDQLSTVAYSLCVGLMVWAIITVAPSFNTWIFKGTMFGIMGAMLSTTYFQASIISVLSCVICDVFTLFITVDLELMQLLFFVKEGKTTIIIAFILPIIISALTSNFRKELSTEGVDGVSR